MIELGPDSPLGVSSEIRAFFNRESDAPNYINNTKMWRLKDVESSDWMTEVDIKVLPDAVIQDEKSNYSLDVNIINKWLADIILSNSKLLNTPDGRIPVQICYHYYNKDDVCAVYTYNGVVVVDPMGVILQYDLTVDDDFCRCI
jgi:hypothetical protein